MKTIPKKERIKQMIKKKKSVAREWIDTIFWGGLIAIVFRSLLLEPFNIPSGSMIPSLQVGDHLFVKKWPFGYSRFSFPFGSWNLWNGRFFAYHEPDVGDIIVFRKPGGKVEYVKRLIGKPGDTIQMKNGRLYINGQMVERKDAKPFIVANLPKSVRSIGYYRDNMSIKGNKIFVDNEPAPFNYTIEYKSDKICKVAPYECGVFDATEYTEVLPNGAEHKIIEMVDNAPLDNTEIFTVPDNHLFFMGDNRDNSADSRTASVSYVNRDNVLGPVWFIWYSHNYYSPMLAVWNWGKKMRWDRFGKGTK